jgi:predicted 2-oxoglutarate/Fe(II)-dependent dioxygenase YbiX/peroxiredoxin
MTAPQPKVSAPAPLGEGEPAPFFTAAALGGASDFAFNTVAGRPVLLLFYGSAGRAEAQAALDAVAARRALFDDVHACFFGVTVDPADVTQRRIAPDLPGIRHFIDADRAVSRLYGAAAAEGSDRYVPHWLLLDARLRVIARYPIGDSEAALDALESARAEPFPGDWAPVLLVERVFEPDLCAELIDLYLRHGGEESGFMRDVGGRTELIRDRSHKVRRDCVVADEALKGRIATRIRRRLLPMVRRAFQFDATRMERYLVACYDAADGGHFRPHRDNTTRGTAHRRFAVSINLNAGEHDGGALRFPEYGRRTYTPPTGGAVVFSCGLLHEATPVTRGRRFAFLPFLYDEAAARLREDNARFLADPAASAYRAG